MTEPSPDLEPESGKRRRLPLGLAMSFFLVPAAAFVYVSRDAWLPGEVPPESYSPPWTGMAPRSASPPENTTAPPETATTVAAPPPREMKAPAQARPTEVPDVDMLKEADRTFEEGEKRLSAGTGKRPSPAHIREAMTHFEKARDAYRAYLERHPERERGVASRLQRVNSQIFWCRKELPLESDGHR